MRLRPSHRMPLMILCVLLLATTAVSLVFEYERPWKQYQKQFQQIQSPSPDEGAHIRQIWLPQFGTSDRCMTCHIGVDDPELQEASLPFRTHPGDYLDKHPVEKFGCTICHQGQGEALTVSSAHGEETGWRQPLLKGIYVQSSCGKCHALEQSLPSEVRINGGAIYSEGWRLFTQNNCIGCHPLRSYQRPDHIAPSLKKIGRKVTRRWLISWLKNPKDYYSYARMPVFRLTDEERGYIADYLLQGRTAHSNDNPRIHAPSEKLIAKGKELVNSHGCLGCHIINNQGVAFGPDFSDIGNKVRPDWLTVFLKEPKAYDPETIIPDFKLLNEDIPAITAYLMSLKKISDNGGDSGESDYLHSDVEKGRDLINDLGCAGCHGIEGITFIYNAPDLSVIGDKRIDQIAFGNLRNIRRDVIHWLTKKVTDPGVFTTDRMIMRMPDFKFSEHEAQALTVFLLSLKKNSFPSRYVKPLFDMHDGTSYGMLLIEKYNCRGCHEISNRGGTVGPILTREALKSRPEWLFSFLLHPVKIRPAGILPARMPDFRLSEGEADSIVQFFARSANVPYPYEKTAKALIAPEDIYDGEKLYTEIFACIACHTVDGKGGTVGPDHSDLASRLKRQWVEQWLKNPQAIKPDARMPRYRFEEWQFQALTNYLMTLSRYRFVTPALP